MDDADIAEDLRELEMRRLLNARAAARSTTTSAIECIDCGEPIPEERRQAAPGCQCCIFCQSEREREVR